MRIRLSLIACAAALVASMSASYAGPCSEEITRFRTEIEAKQRAKAATGPPAPESTAAMTHRQPTLESIGAAESQLGEESPEKLQAVWPVVERASEATAPATRSLVRRR
jgi:biotin carboxylase